MSFILMVVYVFIVVMEDIKSQIKFKIEYSNLKEGTQNVNCSMIRRLLSGVKQKFSAGN